MNLIGFEVNDFRSIKDSKWVDVDNVTALIGANESGKTNLLVPLWKLNPANEGLLDPIQDYPRNRYNEIRSLDKKPVFIKTKYSLNNDENSTLSRLSHINDVNNFTELLVEMDYNGNKYIYFPNCQIPREYDKEKIISVLETSNSFLTSAEATKQEEILKVDMISSIEKLHDKIKSTDNNVLTRDDITQIVSELKSLNLEKAVKTSIIKPTWEKLIESIECIVNLLNIPEPKDIPEVIQYVYDHIPSFVYYSNYGNLDSEIYLPHVISNMDRTDLGTKEAAKARTLRVLFEFVRLSPQEILDLGKDTLQGHQPQNQTEIDEVAKRKKERDILLQSASTELTRKFKDWWKQGEYRFRFQADGDHFRIWVSDEKRPEDIELEGRSTGLQWFLSFFLVFLVESKKKHLNSILLLDEPGLSLHPMAQKDLALFFENLSQTNQILYTTHSPFLIDTDKLDRVRSVYIDDDGFTEVSPDLRASQSKRQQQISIFPVHAALGLSVSDTLLIGCNPVIVEGQSDQNYLTVIKNWLITNGLIKPMKEIVFIPAGGSKGIKALLPIITGLSDALPYVIVDSDNPGKRQYKELIDGIYNADKEKAIPISSLISLPLAEVEDIIPPNIIVAAFDSIYRVTDQLCADTIKGDIAIINQIEEYASLHQVILETPGWKVNLSKNVKMRVLKRPELLESEGKYIDIWKKLFDRII